METNNFPDRIYLPRDAEYPQSPDIWWEREPNESNIEYIRTDTLIERAVNFLEMLGCGFTITDNITKSLYDNIQLIEDFKKYVSYENRSI